MNRRRAHRMSWGLLVPFLLLLGGGCSEPLTVEQQIIVTIREMETLIEARDRSDFMDHIADDFRGQYESLNRNQVGALILFQLNRHENLQVQLFPIDVTELAPERAEARFHALLTGGSGVLPEAGQMYEIQTRWELREDKWLLTSAEWNPSNMDIPQK